LLTLQANTVIMQSRDTKILSSHNTENVLTDSHRHQESAYESQQW